MRDLFDDVIIVANGSDGGASLFNRGRCLYPRAADEVHINELKDRASETTRNSTIKHKASFERVRWISRTDRYEVLCSTASTKLNRFIWRT